MTATEDSLAFLAAETEYWRRRCRALADRLYDAHRAIAGTDLYGCVLDEPGDEVGLPPEPPVGTQFIRGGDPAAIAWKRRAEGWYCDADECEHCPCDWREASNWRPTDRNDVTRKLPHEHIDYGVPF